jgi:hypothetical protein
MPPGAGAGASNASRFSRKGSAKATRFRDSHGYENGTYQRLLRGVKIQNIGDLLVIATSASEKVIQILIASRAGLLRFARNNEMPRVRALQVAGRGW